MDGPNYMYNKTLSLEFFDLPRQWNQKSFTDEIISITLIQQVYVYANMNINSLLHAISSVLRVQKPAAQWTVNALWLVSQAIPQLQFHLLW